MAGLRRRRKSGGFTRTSTNKGWTTSSSYGAGKKGGTGYRVTTTHKADGRTIIRRTTRGGDGWFKIEQQTLGSPSKTKFNHASGSGSGAIVLVALALWLLAEVLNWLKVKFQPIVDFIETHSVADVITVVVICCVGTWLFFKLLLRMAK